MKFSRRERVLIIILILAASTMLLFRYIYTPGKNKINELAAELETSKKVLNELKNKHNEAAKNLQEIKNIDNEIRALDRMMPGDMDVPGTMVEFYKLLTDNNLTGDTITLGEVTQGKQYDFFTVSFDARGKREDIDLFLRQLEGLETEISITNLSIIASDQFNFDINISIAVYLFKTDEKREYTPDYYFMEENSGTYKNWYEMFKAMEKENGMDISGGLNGAENQ